MISLMVYNDGDTEIQVHKEKKTNWDKSILWFNKVDDLIFELRDYGYEDKRIFQALAELLECVDEEGNSPPVVL